MSLRCSTVRTSGFMVKCLRCSMFQLAVSSTPRCCTRRFSFGDGIDVGSGKELARWQAHDSALTALAVSSDGKLLVSGASDGTVRVWNLPWIRAELRKIHPDLDW